MLKSNGLHRPKIRLKKFVFSLKTVPANIAKKLPPQRCFKPLFNFPHKRPTFAFAPKSGYTLGFRRRIAHKGTHGETGGVSDGVLLLLSDCFTRFGNAGQGVERQTLPLLGFGWMYFRRTQRAFGTAMCLCASLFRGVVAPLGCVIQ